MSKLRSRSFSTLAGIALALLAVVSPPVGGVAPVSNFNWTPLAPIGAPAFRCFGATTVYDEPGDKLILFGGNNCAGSTLNDTWILSNAGAVGPGTPIWSPGPPGPMAPRANHTAVYDEANDRMIIFGGCAGGCTPTLNDTWVLVNASGAGGPPSWAPIPTGAAPPPRQGARAAYDPNTNRMILWTGQNGGGSTCCGNLFFDVWVLTNANGLGGPAVWTPLAPAGGPPPGAYYDAMTYDPTSNTLTVFGGGDVGGVVRNATWILTNANGLGGPPAWINTIAEAAPSAPPGTVANGFTNDVDHNKMMIVGGANFDTWVLSGANSPGPTWAQLTTTGNPAGFGLMSLTYDEDSNKAYAFTVNSGNTANFVFILTNANGIVPAPPPPPPATVRAAAKSKFAKEPINIKTKGRTPMTVFGSATFDVTQIVEASVKFGANGTESPVVAGFTQTVKVDKDAFMDRVFYFQKSPLATPCGTTVVKIKGTLASGQQFSGQDTIKIVPCPGPV